MNVCYFVLQHRHLLPCMNGFASGLQKSIDSLRANRSIVFVFCAVFVAIRIRAQVELREMEIGTQKYFLAKAAKMHSEPSAP